MNVVFDTKVLLDIGLARSPFVKASLEAWTRTAQGEDKPMIVPHSLATFYYLVRQAHGNGKALDAVHDLLVTGQVIPFDEHLTRNLADFKDSPVPCELPETFLLR